MADARREAVALKYEAADGAPKVVAKGSGLIAEEIIARAKEAGVFVHESRDLVSLLMNVNLDARIPPQLYIAVAELLAWVYRLESGQPVGDRPGAPLPATVPSLSTPPGRTPAPQG